ncbi:MAG: nuclear transport factor 2 family protein [Chloroflexi bacterium]|nr:nuclear transport factor 2 family protein [Chloroflexota bacterium]
MNREQAEQEVERLAGAWVTAELHGDIAFLESTLAADFVGVGPLGFMLTKDEWLARLQSGDLKYESLDLDEVKVRVYNEAAVLIGRQVQRAVYRGNSISAQLRTTVVLVRLQGNWQLVSLHLSPIGQPPNFGQS